MPNRPRNDNFANAQVIAGSTGHVTGTNVNATKEAGEPSDAPDRNPGGKSVWYRWTAPGSGRATFTTAGSSFDTVLGMYTGTAVNALSALPYGKNDDESSTVRTSRITVDVVAGVTYSIAVDGYNNGPGAASGAVALGWTFTAGVPGNNNFLNAQVIRGASGTVTGSNVNASKEPHEPNHAGNAGGNSVWYRWTAPVSGRATFTTAGSNFNTLLGVYTGLSLATLHPVAANDNAATGVLTSSVTFEVTAGTTYVIAVDGFKATTANAAAATGLIMLNWTSGAPNDNFANAQIIAGASGRVTGSNVGATKETGEPSHSPDDNVGGKSIWYRWTAPSAGDLTVTTAGSNFDTVLGVYAGSSVAALTALGKNDDASSSVRTSAVTVHVTGGTICRIAVDGFNAAGTPGGAVSGNVVLNWSFVPTSTVRLSSLTVSSISDLITLRFTGALDARLASTASSFGVIINGQAVAAESAAYNATTHSVTLALAGVELRTGDAVTVRWTLRDAAGGALAGQIGPVLAQ